MNETMQRATIGDDVRAFARERGVEPYLEPLLEALLRHFPDTSPRLLLEEDPEVEGQRHLTVIFRPDTTDPVAYLEAKDAYTREKFEILPAALRCLVRLGIRGDA